MYKYKCLTKKSQCLKSKVFMFKEIASKIKRLPITSFKTIEKLPEVVFFDYDGTIAEDKHLVEAFKYAMKMNFDKKKDKKFLQNLKKIKKDSEQWAFIKANKSSEIFAKCNEDYDVYISRQKICKVRGAVKLIKKFYKYGIPMFVISQKRGDGLREALKKAKLDEYFSKAYGTLDLGTLQKPSKEFCDKVLEDCKMTEKNIWVIGDRYSDVLTAINFGGKAFIIKKCEVEKIQSEQGSLVGKDIFFTSFRRLKKLVKRLKKAKINA